MAHSRALLEDPVGTRHGVTFSRLYKVTENPWASNPTFGRDDLLVPAKVADLCHT